MNHRTNSNLIQRCLWFIAGVAVNSFGVAFVTKSALGTSQISSIPYVLSLKFPAISFGLFTFFLNMIFILIQILLLRKNFHPVQFLQIGANILFSWMIDLSMGILSFFNPQSLWLRIISLLAGCAILAVGIAVEVAPNVIVVPGEGIVRAFSDTFHIRFGTVKVYFDVTLIVISTVLSLLFFGKLNGVGFGTVVSAVTVGRLVNLVNHRLPLIERIRRKSA